MRWRWRRQRPGMGPVAVLAERIEDGAPLPAGVRAELAELVMLAAAAAAEHDTYGAGVWIPVQDQVRRLLQRLAEVEP